MIFDNYSIISIIVAIITASAVAIGFRQAKFGYRSGNFFFLRTLFARCCQAESYYWQTINFTRHINN